MAAEPYSAAEKQQKVMYDAIPIYCTLWDENFEKIDCNDRAYLFYGMSSKEEYLARHKELSPEFQPDGKASAEKATEMVKVAFEKGHNVFEWMHRTTDGEPLPSEVTFVRVDIDENRRGVVGYTRDLRKVKSAEAKAKNEEYQRLLMLDSMPMGCNLWDEYLQIIDCNYEAAKLLGFTDKTKYLQRYGELSPEFQPDGEPSKQKATRVAKEALTDGACDYEWMHRTLDGELVPTAKSLYAIHLGDGKLGLVGYTKDLREKRAAEAEIAAANERQKVMIDHLSVGCLYLSKDFEAVDCNQEVLNIFGIPRKQDFLERFHEMIPELQPDGRPSMPLAREYMDYVIANGRLDFEWLHIGPTGDPIPMEITLVRVSDMAGVSLVAYQHDLREKKAAEAEIAAANERFRLMFDNNPLGCLYFTKDMHAIDCNDEVLYIFGITNKREFLDRFLEIFPDFQPDGRPSLPLAKEYVDYVLANGRIVFEWLHQTLDGEPVPVEITMVKVKDAVGFNLVTYMRDLRELKEKTARLEEAQKLALSDPLTGINNRRSFLQKSKHEFMEQQDLSPIGIIMLDIDHFKRVNDTYGHEAGDEILKAVSKTIGSALRETDLFARYGGEEFIVMVQHLELPDLAKLAERVCEKVRSAIFSYVGQKISVTISAGVAMRTEIGETIEEVIKHADVALYRAKANGRDRVETISSDKQHV
ncbi:MAG: diguanylate cyclase [Holophagales bacterium]|jgi:diguanylate cyclase (GGDEF)-like protein|nr:diguanylate cyclase [Holophagales bacterium]